MREPGPADRVRHVVVAHPFDAAGMKANAWEVLDLSAAGELSRPNRTFTMGRAFMGEVAFTPDGKLGIAAQEDGSLGIFKLDDVGVPTVLHASFKGDFYAARVVVAPNGLIYVLDTQWRENGGGIYELAIDCDDNVMDKGLVAASKLPAALEFTAGNHQVVAAVDISDSAMGKDVHMVTFGGPTVIASADAFADDMQIVGGSTLTADGSAFLVGDISQYGTAPNRVAVVPVTGTQLGTPYMIPNVEDPIALYASPFADKVLVVSGFGDAMFTLTKQNGMYAASGEVTYQGAKPQLPGGAVMIDRGMLRGLVLVAENLGVRKVEMYAAGTIVDRGMYSLGSGLVNTTGAIGVTP
ncbi:MAG TPA: hypothetical protein VIV11_09535 [Kofleriaceae bacterium]